MLSKLFLTTGSLAVIAGAALASIKLSDAIVEAANCVPTEYPVDLD